MAKMLPQGSVSFIYYIKMIKNNQITPFSKTCDLETAFKEKQSKMDIRKVDLYLRWSLMTPFVAKWLKYARSGSCLIKSLFSY